MVPSIKSATNSIINLGSLLGWQGGTVLILLPMVQIWVRPLFLHIRVSISLVWASCMSELYSCVSVGGRRSLESQPKPRQGTQKFKIKNNLHQQLIISGSERHASNQWDMCNSIWDPPNYDPNRQRSRLNAMPIPLQ